MADDYAASTATLGVLTAGGSTSGSFETAFDRDWLRINLQKGVTYQFVLSGASGGGGTLVSPAPASFDISVGVRNLSTNITQHLAYTGGPGGLPSAPFTPTFSGEHFIVLSSAIVGTYTLFANIVPTDDFGSTVELSGTTTVGASVDGSIGVVNDRDWFKVQLDAGMISMTLADRNGGAGAYTLALYDAAGAYVYPGEGVAAGSGVHSLTQLVPAPATYFVQVRSTVSAGDYTLSLSTPQDDIAANPSTASTLAIGGAASGVTNYGGDADWFKVELQAGLLYSFTAASLAGVAAPALSAYGAGDTALWNGSGSFAVATSGVYYLQAQGAAAGAYQVTAASVTDDFGASAESAGQLTRGFALAGRFDAPNDQDWFRLPLEEGRFYRIEARFAGTASLPGKVPYITLPAADDKPYRLLSTEYGSGSYSVVVRATATGDMMMRMGMDAVIAYELLATDLGADDAADSASKAVLQTGTTAVQGRFEVQYDMDAYKFQLEAGVTYVFTGTGPLVPGTGFSQLSLRTDLLFGNAYHTTAVTRFTPQTSGEHTLYALGYAAGTYSIAMTRAADDFGANAAQAGSLAIGSSNTGDNSSYEDRDWFAVDLVAGQTYWFDASFSNTVAGEMRLRAADGAVLAQANHFYSYSTIPTLSYAAPADGRYYLEVGARASDGGGGYGHGKYTVAARTGTADDHVDTVTLALGQLVAGQFEIGSDRDSFRFDLQAGTYYKLVYDRYDASGVLVAESRGYFSSGSQYAPTLTTAGSEKWILPTVSGSYLFAAAPDNIAASAAAGSYRVRLDTVGPDDQWQSSAPRALQLGASVTGVLEVSGDTDIFSLDLRAGQKVDVSLASGIGTIGLDYYPYVATSVVASNGRPHLVFTAPSDGTYRVLVNGTKGTYQVHVADNSADVSAPTLLNMNSVINYRERVVLEFSENILWSGEIRLMDSLGNAVVYPSNGITTGNTASFSASNLIPGQTYKLSIPAGTFVDHAGNRYAGSAAVTVKVADAAGPTDGNDIFVSKLNGSTINGGAGLDTVVMSYLTSSLQFSVPTPGTVVVKNYSGGQDTLVGIERLYGHSTWAMAFDTAGNGVGGAAYRLYQAAFDRTPDKAGVGYWMSAMDKGMSLTAVAQGFVDSTEFRDLYGANATNRELVSRLYLNVLNRPGETAGIDFWTGVLDAGTSRAEVLAGFSESAENVAFVAAVIGKGFEFIPYG